MIREASTIRFDKSISLEEMKILMALRYPKDHGVPIVIKE